MRPTVAEWSPLVVDPVKAAGVVYCGVEINRPAVLAEVRAEFDRYEAALVANDVEALVAWFRVGPETVRYGLDDAQHGWDEIAAFRRAAASASPPRELLRTVITTFGDDVAVADTEFVAVGTITIGRQSQTWIRTPAGWRIVSAHVSRPLGEGAGAPAGEDPARG
jgi:hypothetical protein